MKNLPNWPNDTKCARNKNPQKMLSVQHLRISYKYCYLLLYITKANSADQCADETAQTQLFMHIMHITYCVN